MSRRRGRGDQHEPVEVSASDVAGSEVIEVDVFGSSTDGPANGGAPTPGSRRTLMMVAGAVAVAVVVVIAAGVFDAGDDDASTPTTVAPVDLDAPPTLPPTVPPTVTADADIDDLPDATASRRVDLLPPLESIAADVEGALFGTMRQHALDRPLRSRTEMTIGDRGFEMTVQVDADAANELLGIEISFRNDALSGVVDLAQRTAYTLGDDGAWSTTMIPEDGPDWRQLVLGPLDVDVLARAEQLGTIEEGDTVSFRNADGEARIGQVFWVTVSADQMTGWAPYVLGPIGEAAPIDGSTPIDLRVLIEQPGRRLGGIDWYIPYGNTVQVVSHRLAYPGDVTVEVPDIAGSPVTSTP